MIDVRNKGRSAEQEVCRWLNSIAAEAYCSKGLEPPETPIFQRNQNQTAVGGSDITNPYNLSIEVKRHEQLSVDTWWQQCYEDSVAFGGIPVLLYRQNGKRKWHAVMMVHVPLVCHLDRGESSYRFMPVRAELRHEDFERFLYTWILDNMGASAL